MWLENIITATSAWADYKVPSTFETRGKMKVSMVPNNIEVDTKTKQVRYSSPPGQRGVEERSQSCDVVKERGKVYEARSGLDCSCPGPQIRQGHLITHVTLVVGVLARQIRCLSDQALIYWLFLKTIVDRGYGAAPQ